jgi:hypothetical protein
VRFGGDLKNLQGNGDLDMDNVHHLKHDPKSLRDLEEHDPQSLRVLEAQRKTQAVHTGATVMTIVNHLQFYKRLIGIPLNPT